MATRILPFVSVLALMWSWPASSRELAGNHPSGRPDDRPAVGPRAAGCRPLADLPAAFVPNLGQWDQRARFVARTGSMTVFVGDRGWTFTLVDRGAEREENAGGAPARGVAVSMTFVGAGDPELAAERRLPGVHHYYLGDDPARWREDVPLYGAVRYRGPWTGVDARLREHEGHLEYDLLLAPDARLGDVDIRVEGAGGLRLDPDGALVIETALGPVRMAPPPSWEAGPSGERRPIACRFVVRGPDRFGFATPERRPDWALVVDPGLVWSTFVGGTSGDEAWALDGGDEVTIGGRTWASNFPTTPGAFDPTYNGNSDAFVSRLSATGAGLVWSTYLGGARAGESVVGVAVDARGGATVTGTAGPGFPTTGGAFHTTYNGGSDAFVARFAPSGVLDWSTYLGASDFDEALALAVDAQGDATVVGRTRSAGFPTTPGALDTSHNGFSDGFVSRLSATGASLVYSTYLGGVGGDKAWAVAVDGQGVATVAGQTDSTGFPTTPGAFDTTHNGSSDAFVARLSASGGRLVWSTFLGGTGHDQPWEGVAVDALGRAVVAGRTRSTDFPTTSSAFDTTYNGGSDAFVTLVSATGTSLVWSTYLGGRDSDMAREVAVDGRGAITVAGTTESGSFPTTAGAYERTYGGRKDSFVARLSPTGEALEYSTFLGGAESDQARGLALDARGAATVAGFTGSAGFPTTPGAFDVTFEGGDAFVTRLDMLPSGVSAFGRSSPGCSGPLASSVTSMPRLGHGGFAVTCGNAPPSATGALLLAASRLGTPQVLLGAELWVDPGGPWFAVVPARSNRIGGSISPLPIPSRPALLGQTLHAQLAWVGPSSPMPCPPRGVSASHALAITILP